MKNVIPPSSPPELKEKQLNTNVKEKKRKREKNESNMIAFIYNRLKQSLSLVSRLVFVDYLFKYSGGSNCLDLKSLQF